MRIPAIIARLGLLFTLASCERAGPSPMEMLNNNGFEQVVVMDTSGNGLEGATVWVSYNSSPQALEFTTNEHGIADLKLEEANRQSFHSIIVRFGEHSQNVQKSDKPK